MDDCIFLWALITCSTKPIASVMISMLRGKDITIPLQAEISLLVSNIIFYRTSLNFAPLRLCEKLHARKAAKPQSFADCLSYRKFFRMPGILIIDDEKAIRNVLKEILG